MNRNAYRRKSNKDRKNKPSRKTRKSLKKSALNKSKNLYVSVKKPKLLKL